MACFSQNCNNCDDTLVCWFVSDSESVDIANVVDGYYSQGFDGCRALISVNGLPSSAMSQYLETVHEFTGSTSLGSTTDGGGYEGYGDGDICNSCEISDEYIRGAHVVEYGLRRMAPEGHEESPSNYTEILENSMSGLGNLVQVYIPSSVKKINDGAFSGCGNLKTLIVGTNTKKIGNEAFKNCGIENIDWGCCNDKELRLGNEAFRYNNSLKDVDIADCIKKCGTSCFSNCSNLSGVTIGNGLTELGAFIFNNCPKLESVTIPSTIKSVGEWAFGSCTSLTSITIPDSVSTVGGDAFSGCTSVSSITIGSGVTSIGNNAFECPAVQVLNYNAEVGIPNDFMHDKVYLRVVTIGDKTPSIGESAFMECSALTNVAIGRNVKTINAYAFSDCESLTNIVIPDSVTTIGPDAFFNCIGLTSVTIGNGVTTINNAAFYGCISLESVTIDAIVPPVLESGNEFNNTNNCPIYVPSGSVSTYKTAEGWRNYASRIVSQ